MVETVPDQRAVRAVPLEVARAATLGMLAPMADPTVAAAVLVSGGSLPMVAMVAAMVVAVVAVLTSHQPMVATVAA